MIMGVRYIHAVSSTGYKSATSGKKAATADNNKATPNEKANKKIIKTGNNKADGRKVTPVTAKIIPNGTNAIMKFTMFAKIVDTTNEVRGT